MEKRITVRINGIEVEQSFKRAPKCACCNREYTLIVASGATLVKTEKAVGGQPCYVCTECVKHHSYGFNLPHYMDDINGKAVGRGIRLAVEWEAFYPTTNEAERAEIDAKLAASYHFVPSKDCTVDVEYHEPNRLNLHSFKREIEGMLSTGIIFDNSHAGHHINVSDVNWTHTDLLKIRRHKLALFMPLQEYMVNHEEDTEKVFGRYFTRYACECENNSDFCHGYWLNLENDNRIEFRLAHFKNTNQFFYLANLCEDITEKISEFLYSDKPVEKTAREIVKLFQKYAAGKAACQAPKRNTK